MKEQQREPEIRPEDMPKTMKSWLCHKCGADFGEHIDYIGHIKAHQEGSIPDKNPQEELKEAIREVEKPKERREIRLKYVFEGECADCGRAVDIVTVDLDKKKPTVVCVAWCNSCKKQWDSKEVARI